MKYIYLIISLISTSLFAQKPDAWVSKEAETNPLAYIERTAKEVPSTPVEKAGKLFAICRCYEYLNQEDLALKYYLQSKKEFERLKLVSPAKDIALEVHKVISSQENYDKYGRLFLDEYFAYAQKIKSPERLARSWSEFSKIAHDKFYETENVKYLDTSETLGKRALQYVLQTKNTVLKAQLYNNIATIKSSGYNFPEARTYLSKGHEFAILSHDSYEMFANYFNYSITYFYEGNYTKALAWLKKAEKYAIPKYKSKTKRVFYKKLMETYDALNDQPNRRKYQKLYLDIEKKINDEAQNIAIHDINVKYQTVEKDRKISSLEKFKAKFYKNRIVFGILLFLVFLLALYSFVRWKKLDYRKKKLEVEKFDIEERHSRTVEELEKVKNIVTEGFILLKDKTKIYLNDLMYIKSDDHYLYAFGKDGKNHFVRGSLSQILSELPPNFVKCHRSYIINTNYIHSIQRGYVLLQNKEEIPTSRGFKL